MSDAVNHPFNKLMLRCERASKQVKEYEALWVSLREAYPSKIAPKLNPKTGHTDFYVTQLTPIDPELSAIAGEVFHNLRAALDNLAWNLVLSNGGSPGRHTGFPVFDTLAEYSDPRYGAARKIKGMHQLAIDEVNRLAPYEAGNRPLWLIHKLDILDKHRLLITAGQANMAAFAPEGCKIVSPGGGLAILNEGDKIFTVEGLKLNDKVKFVIDVALNEPNLVSPSPLYLILNYSGMEVRHIIRNFGRFVK